MERCSSSQKRTQAPQVGGGPDFGDQGGQIDNIGCCFRDCAYLLFGDLWMFHFFKTVTIS